MTKTPNSNENNNGDEDFDAFRDDFENQFNKFNIPEPIFEHNLNYLRKYASLNPSLRDVINSRAFQEDIRVNTAEILSPEEQLQKVIDIYVATIYRNLPNIDENLVRNLVSDTIEGTLPLIFKASEEIKHRYEDTGKFEGYEHHDIKAIIEKHLMSAHNSSKSTFHKFMEKIGTPMHEIFGKGNHVMGEQGKVFNNVHTAVTRGGTIFAAGLAVKELSALFPVYGAVPLAGILFTMTQAINEVTNEAEHTTLEKRNPLKRLTKWTTIAAAKAAPIALLAVSSMGGISPNLEQNYLKNQGNELAKEVIERSHGQTKDGKIPLLRAKLKEIDVEIVAKEAQLATTKQGDPMRETLLRVLNGAKPKYMQEGEIALKKQKEKKEKEISDALKVNAELIAEYQDKGPVNFIVNHAELKYGGSSGAATRFRETINDYSKLDAAARISNGWNYMDRKIIEKEYTDELFTMIYIAILVESLSVITLLLVQSRADFRKVITNSDAQKALAQIIEGAVLLNKQVAAETEFNEFRSDEDKLLTQNAETEVSTTTNRKFTELTNLGTESQEEKEPKGKFAKFLLSTKEGLLEIREVLDLNLSKARVEPPSYSSLVKSIAIQRAIQEMFRDGHIPAMNQITHDISRDLINPIPLDLKAMAKLEAAKKALNSDKDKLKEEELKNDLVAIAKHNEKFESDPKNLIDYPRGMTREIEKQILSNAKNHLATENLALNLSRILDNKTPVKEENYQKLLELLDGMGKKEAYEALMKRLKDLNSDAQDVINNYGASKDRLDLKNMFRDQLRDAIKKFENNESYNESITEKPLTNLVQGIENQESNSSLNYIRMDTAVSYLKGLVSKDSLSPILLNDMIESLKTGDAVIVSTSKGDIELLEKIKELHLASPYETSVESTIFKMQNLATEYMTLKRNWFMQDKKLTKFKDSLGVIMMDYEKESRDEKMKKRSA